MSTPAAGKPLATLVVHGHFYQPPRDNPWTDEMPREPSAAPFHDWNARINAECYRANAYARIYGSDDRVRAMVNNYGRLSFNFGPTLARWIARHDPRTMAQVRAGDAEQVRRLGHGGAMAQVWAHPIAPLLSPRDRRTQIRWGLQDFRRRFGREAEGMWLPETAADPATLEALIDAGVRFTILAPEQIAAVRAPGEAAWTTVDRDSLDTGRAYRWVAGDGRSITVAIFDGPLSRELAFGNAVRDAHTYLHRIRESAERSKVTATPPLVLAASDGELYGHHKKFADLTLAYATAVEAEPAGFQVTNLAAFLAEHPAVWEAELAKGSHGEGTAWSCAHGLGRWRRHCGCAFRDGWSQAWRAPLRDALDLLRDRTAALFDDLGAGLFADPWGARDAYGEVIDDDPGTREALLRSLGQPALAAGERAAVARAHLLMEMQRSALAMYASCGWFFDDVAGLESALVLRLGAHVLDLWRAVGQLPPTDDVLDVLAMAKSNDARQETGADVMRRVARERVTPAVAVASTAFGALAATAAAADAEPPPGFAVRLPLTAQPLAIVQGEATVIQARSGVASAVRFTASYDGEAGFECIADGERITLADLDEATGRPMRLAVIARLAEQEPTLPHCRAALDMARVLGPLSGRESEALGARFADMLLGLLRSPASVPADETVWEVAAELLERADLGKHGDEALLAEDLVWDIMGSYLESKRTPPRGLRALAERLRLAPEAAAASNEESAIP
jgi:alpha-amylase/alpha-mannosidase (GH57 family)